MQKKIVVSLCGGTDSAYLSCIDAGIDVSPTGDYEYHTFETDKYASAVSRHNIPHAIHHGDANGWRELFYLFENVESKAKFEWLTRINLIRRQQCWTDAQMYTHDSAKVSAQSRKRVYITNIPHNELADMGIILNDVLEDGAMADRDKSYCIDANYFKGGSMKMYYQKARRQIVYVQGEKIALKSKKCRQVGEADLKGYDIIKRVYSRWGKSPTLTTMQGGWRMPKVETDELHWRALTPLECERLQTLPDEWTKYGVFGDKLDVTNISNSQRYKMIGNGFTRAVISHILEGVYT